MRKRAAIKAQRLTSAPRPSPCAGPVHRYILATNPASKLLLGSLALMDDDMSPSQGLDGPFELVRA